MEIGKKYVEGFLLNKDKGGGCYLEYHDTPHLHIPLNKDSKGYLILGKFSKDEVHLSEFSIPYGYAIYTPSLTIHCDGFLVGHYMVLYTITPNYSTALLRSKNGITNVLIERKN